MHKKSSCGFQAARVDVMSWPISQIARRTLTFRSFFRVRLQAWFKALSLDILEHFTCLARGDQKVGAKMIPYWLQFKERQEFESLPLLSDAWIHLLEGECEAVGI
jgi:hypothetical protein